MLIDYNKAIQHIDLVRQGTIKEGLKLGFDEIDEYLRFKEGNFNVILGHANVGKTTLILYLMLAYSKSHNMRWLVFSSENEAHSVIRKLVEFLAGSPINKIDEEDYKNHLEYIQAHFKIIDNEKLYNYRELIEVARGIKKAWDYQGFLIDPYNSLIKDPEMNKSLGGHEYDYQATTEIRQFCKKTRVSVWLNTHANTQALRMKHPIGHEYAGHPIPPLASDVEGGGKFVNRADDFIVIHRYVQHPTDWVYSMVHIRKVKEVETGGRPTPIDAPIKFKSIVNNVGFEMNSKKVIDIPIREQSNIPF